MVLFRTGNNGLMVSHSASLLSDQSCQAANPTFRDQVGRAKLATRTKAFNETTGLEPLPTLLRALP